MATVAYEDLSGTTTPITSNPFDGILQACNNDPHQIQTRYTTHRTTRNNQQAQKILSQDFPGWNLDPNLVKLTGPRSDPTFVDPRNCLVFWARPTLKIRNLIHVIQQQLQTVAPGLWLMPLDNLHLTAMEITHSKTAEEIDFLVTSLQPSSREIADLTAQPGHAARLIKPMLSFDTAALALSFVPAAGEGLTRPAPSSSSNTSRTPKDDKFTYHHLRRKIHSLVSANIPVASRYIVPSAHLTIARFNTPNPFASIDTTTTPPVATTGPATETEANEATETEQNDPLNAQEGTSLTNRQHLIAKIEEMNAWLKDEYWPRPVPKTSPNDEHEDGDEINTGPNATEVIPDGGEWIVGEEKGLDFRKGRLWYGGGETIYLGKRI